MILGVAGVGVGVAGGGGLVGQKQKFKDKCEDKMKILLRGLGS